MQREKNDAQTWWWHVASYTLCANDICTLELSPKQHFHMVQIEMVQKVAVVANNHLEKWWQYI